MSQKTGPQQDFLKLWSREQLKLLTASTAIRQLARQLEDGEDVLYAPAIRASLVAQARLRTDAACAFLADLMVTLDKLVRETEADMKLYVEEVGRPE